MYNILRCTEIPLEKNQFHRRRTHKIRFQSNTMNQRIISIQKGQIVL